MTTNLSVSADVIYFIFGRGTMESKSIKKEDFRKDVTYSGRNIIPEYHKDFGSDINYSYISVPNPKDDSKYYKKEDIDGILELIKEHYDKGARTFIMSFGTDKMIGVARYADDFFKSQRIDKIKFVITGSMDPLENIYNGLETDAPSNLQFIDLQIKNGTIPYGTSIVMHGSYFDPHKTAKDYPNKRFKSFDSANAAPLITLQEEHETLMKDKTLYNITAA